VELGRPGGAAGTGRQVGRQALTEARRCPFGHGDHDLEGAGSDEARAGRERAVELRVRLDDADLDPFLRSLGAGIARGRAAPADGEHDEDDCQEPTSGRHVSDYGRFFWALLPRMGEIKTPKLR
jgi:hypothetical protein